MDWTEPALPLDGRVRAMAVTAFLVEGKGWRVAVSSRRDFERWEDGRSAVYEGLSWAEVVDVLDAESGS